MCFYQLHERFSFHAGGLSPTTCTNIISLCQRMLTCLLFLTTAELCCFHCTVDPSHCLECPSAACCFFLKKDVWWMHPETIFHRLSHDQKKKITCLSLPVWAWRFTVLFVLVSSHFVVTVSEQELSQSAGWTESQWSSRASGLNLSCCDTGRALLLTWDAQL